MRSIARAIPQNFGEKLRKKLSPLKAILAEGFSSVEGYRDRLYSKAEEAEEWFGGKTSANHYSSSGYVIYNISIPFFVRFILCAACILRPLERFHALPGCQNGSQPIRFNALAW